MDVKRLFNFKDGAQKNGVNLATVLEAVPKTVIGAVIDGGGIALATGAKSAYVSVPFNCTIVKWRLLADVAGAAVVDIWKDTYANYPPVNADSMTASAKPTISATNPKAESTSVSTWAGGTAQMSEGDILEFEIESCATITRLRCELWIVPR